MPLSRNLGTLTAWNPLGHCRPVKGLLYLEPSGPLQACNGTALPLPSIAIRPVLLTEQCSGYQNEEMGWASSKDGGEKRHTQGFGGET